MNKEKLSAGGFNNETLTSEESFWVMWYFIDEQNKISQGQFDLADVLSASQAVPLMESRVLVPADGIMAAYWNEAIDKFKKYGIPGSNKVS
ncbi:MAG: hypothetical protein AB8B74_04310 [Crocinitomicaceae bacterium]